MCQVRSCYWRMFNSRGTNENALLQTELANSNDNGLIIYIEFQQITCFDFELCRESQFKVASFDINATFMEHMNGAIADMFPTKYILKQ